MRVTQFAPSSALAPFVRALEIVETDVASTRVVLPTPGLTLGFRYSGWASVVAGTSRFEVPCHVMMGMRSTSRHLFTSPGGAIILAQFHAGGAAAFFDLPLHQLFDAASSLEDLIEPREIEATSARIAKAESHEQRVTVLEQFLLVQRARIPRSEDRLVVRVLHAIGADPGSFRVAPCAGKLGLSVDALEKRFRRAVGTSPKQLASIMRLRRAVEARDESSSLTRLAVDAGYYDQAHFVRHFKAVTGVAPRAFLASIADCV